jgi:transcriptional regulator with XRE-family HTH domain
MNQPELGRKINEIRNRNGITQNDLSEKCNIDIRTIQRIESGEVFPRASTLKLISEILGLDYHELIENEQVVQSESGSFRILLLITLVAGVMHLVNWFFYAPLFPSNLTFNSYNWVFSIIDVISTVFFYYGFILIAKYYENKILRSASIFFMIGGPVYFIITIVTGALNIDAGKMVNQLILSILGINCIFFGLGLLKIKSRLSALYKSTAILQFLIAPFFILPVRTLNIVGCWLNVPLYILMMIIIYLECRLLKKSYQ